MKNWFHAEKHKHLLSRRLETDQQLMPLCGSVILDSIVKNSTGDSVSKKKRKYLCNKHKCFISDALL